MIGFLINFRCTHQSIPRADAGIIASQQANASAGPSAIKQSLVLIPAGGSIGAKDKRLRKAAEAGVFLFGVLVCLFVVRGCFFAVV